MKKILLSFYLIILNFTMNAQLTFISDPNPSLITQSSGPNGYIKFGDYVYFSAFDGIRRNVYKTDGTSSGTEACIPDINFTKTTVINNKLYFLGVQQDTISGLFISDGTPEGTQCLYRCSYDPRVLFVNGTDIYFTAYAYGKSQICSYNIDQNIAKIYPGSHTLTSESTAFSFKNDFYFFDNAMANGWVLFKINPSEAKLDTVIYTPISNSFKPYYHIIYNDSIRVFYRKDLDLWLTSSEGTKATNKTSMLISNADISSAPVLYNDSITFIGNGNSNSNLTLFKVKPFAGYKRTKIADYGSLFEYKNCLIDGKLLFLPSLMNSDIFVCSNSSIIKGTMNKSNFDAFRLPLSHLGKNGDYDYFVYSNLIIKINLNTASSEVIDIISNSYTETAQLNGDLFYTKYVSYDIEPWHFNFSNLQQEKFADINSVKESASIQSFTEFNNAYYFKSLKRDESQILHTNLNKLSKEGISSPIWQGKNNAVLNTIGIFNNNLFMGTNEGLIFYTDNTKIDTIKGLAYVTVSSDMMPGIVTDKLIFNGRGLNETDLSIYTLNSNLELTQGPKIGNYYPRFTTSSTKAFYIKDSVPENSYNTEYYLVSTDGTVNNKPYIEVFNSIGCLYSLPSWENVLIAAKKTQQQDYYSYYFNDGTPEKLELIGNYKSAPGYDPIKLKKQYIFQINSDTTTYMLTGGTVAGTMFLYQHNLKAYSEINDNLFLSIFSQKTKKNSLVYKPATSNNYTTIKNFNDSVITSMCATTDNNIYFLVKHSENSYDLWYMNGTSFNTRKMETLNLGDKILPKLMAVDGSKAFLLCTDAEYGEALYYYTFTPPTSISEKEVSATIKIGPNPVESYITIESPAEIITIEITDLTGRKVDQIKNINTNQYNVMFSGRTAGVYFVKIELKDGSKMVKKIVKN